MGGEVSRGEKRMFRVVLVLFGMGLVAEGVLVVMGVVPVVNGAGEAITSLFWRLFVGLIACAVGIPAIGTGLFGKNLDSGTDSSDPEWEGTYVEGDVVADVIDGDFDV